jgi:hypothetical protein
MSGDSHCILVGLGTLSGCEAWCQHVASDMCCPALQHFKVMHKRCAARHLFKGCTPACESLLR